MTFRTKVGFSHWRQILLLFFTPAAIIVFYHTLTEGLPRYITICVYAASVLCCICGLIALSAVLKTDYVLENKHIIINYNRENPVIISYDRIKSFEVKPEKIKKIYDAVSYARSNDTVLIKYADNTAKTIKILVSPFDKLNFTAMLKEKLENEEVSELDETVAEKDNNTDETSVEEYTEIDDYDEFESRNKNGGFKINLPDDFFNEE